MLRPKCMPFTYVEGKRKFIADLWPPTTTFNGPAYTADGFFVPCCFCDNPSYKEDMEKWGFYQDDLHIDNNQTAEDIFTSEVWRKWVDMLQHNPSDAPKVCFKKCKMQDDY